MFYDSLLDIKAKRLALLANGKVQELARAIALKDTGGADYPSEITGAALAMMPHIVEKAIVVAPSLPGDVSARLTTMFVDEFEAVNKMICNAGGFANPVKRALFNASFHAVFRRQYKALKPFVDKTWDMPRELQQSDAIAAIALATLVHSEKCSKLKLASEDSLAKTDKFVRSLFVEVHDVLDGRA
jgi:hypothetical protein